MSNHLVTVQDAGFEGKLTDKLMLITGCCSGGGIQTAQASAVTDSRAFAGVRKIQEGETDLSEIVKSGNMKLLKMDMNR